MLGNIWILFVLFVSLSIREYIKPAHTSKLYESTYIRVDTVNALVVVLWKIVYVQRTLQ